MAMLINLNDARKKLNELEGSVEYNKGVTDAFNALFDLPIIEAEPVKHGRWLYNKLWGTECSECGSAMFELIGVRYTTCKPKYCPNCGADMQSTMGQVKWRDAVNEGNTEKTIKGLADKTCDLINQPYFSKLAKACNIVVCDLCDNADQCKDKPLPAGMQCLGWEPIGGCKK